MSKQRPRQRGKVYLVGAGPGTAGSITVRGVECLRRADVVLYDDLVNPRSLQHVREDAQRICLGRSAGGQSWTGAEINARMVQLALAGHTVVRLEGHDPAVSARESEAVEELVRREIGLEIVPGITTALAVESSAGAPLKGQSVLVTRPAGQAASLIAVLEAQGSRVLVQPAIEVLEPEDWGPADAAIAQLDRFHWIVFSSTNGVHALVGRIQANGRDLRALGAARLAAIGRATAEALQEYHLRADCCPQRYQAEDLAAALVDGAQGKRFLLVRASRGRDLLAQELSAAGAEVEQVVFYQSVDVTAVDPTIAASMHDGEIDWTTVTSSAIAGSLARLFREDLGRTRLVSISPITSGTLRELGFEPAAEAIEATMDGVVHALLQHVAQM